MKGILDILTMCTDRGGEGWGGDGVNNIALYQYCKVMQLLSSNKLI